MRLERLFAKYPVLESSWILLKQVEASDLNDLFSIYNNDHVFEFCGIYPKHNIDTVKNMISHFERDFNKKSRVKWGIYTKDPAKMVGIIEAMEFDQKSDKLTIGYYLNQEYWGKGIATESVKILINFLFRHIEVNRIQAEVMPPNNHSKKVLIKNGFIKEGLIRQGSFWPSKGIIDTELYSLLRSEYIIEEQSNI